MIEITIKTDKDKTMLSMNHSDDVGWNEACMVLWQLEEAKRRLLNIKFDSVLEAWKK